MGESNASTKEEKATSFHESGHAVVSVYLGIENIGDPTIVAKGGIAGQIRSYGSMGELAYPEYRKNLVMVLLAGGLAEKLFLGSSDEEVAIAATGDQAHIKGLLRGLSESEEDLKKKTESLMREEHIARAVEEFAGKLLEDKTIPEAEAVRMIMKLRTDKTASSKNVV
jgi:hypothetical protein